MPTKTSKSKTAVTLPTIPKELIDQHIIQRGNNRQPIFAAEADYQSSATLWSSFTQAQPVDPRLCVDDEPYPPAGHA